MKIASTPQNEEERLSQLKDLDILDSGEEILFDSITKIAAQICGCPISLISLVDRDRQWFKSHYGLHIKETPRDISFCSHVVSNARPLVVTNATEDERFFDNPLVTGEPHVKAYAGVPLQTEDGHVLGTLCVIHHKPHHFSEEQIESLNLLSIQVMANFKHRKLLIDHKKELMNFENFAAQVPGAIYLYQLRKDGTSCFPFSSKAIWNVYEVTPQDVQKDAGLVFSRLHPDDYDEIVRTIQESAAHLSDWVCEYRVNLPQKGLRWLRGLARPVRQIDDSIIWHGFIEDITENKNLQEQLSLEKDANIHMNRMAELGEISSNIAHEINNPLSVISGVTEVYKQKKNQFYRDFESLEKLFNLIEQNVVRISKIIKSLKDYTYKDQFIENQMQPSSAQEIIESTISLVGDKLKSEGITLETEVSNFEFNCISSQIEQVLVNLVLNSIYEIKKLEKPWIKIEAKMEKDGYFFSVTDSGPGIAPEIREKLMKSFFTTKPKGIGTGLGLSIVKRIIDRHQGQFFYDDDSEHTRFVFTIPKN